MNFCICCYDYINCEELKSYIEQLNKIYGIESNIFLFYSIDEILKSNISFNIIFMDIKFKEDKQKQKIITDKIYKKATFIFFYYNYSDISNEYSNKSSCIFVKPIAYNDIVKLINKTFYNYKTSKRILIYNGINQICLRINEIIYIEANNKEIGVRTVKEFITAKDTLSSIEEKIKTKNFYKPHRSYLVNMNYIKEFNNRYIIMDNEEKIAISRLKRKSFIDAFTLYINSNY